jgi:hypothetical protein
MTNKNINGILEAGAKNVGIVLAWVCAQKPGRSFADYK